jgi:hypothetical protein
VGIGVGAIGADGIIFFEGVRGVVAALKNPIENIGFPQVKTFGQGPCHWEQYAWAGNISRKRQSTCLLV